MRVSMRIQQAIRITHKHTAQSTFGNLGLWVWIDFCLQIVFYRSVLNSKFVCVHEAFLY